MLLSSREKAVVSQQAGLRCSRSPCWLLLTSVLLSCTTGRSWVDDGEQALREGSLPQAIAYYELAAREQPDELAIRVRLALLLIRDGEQRMRAQDLSIAAERFDRAKALGQEAVQSDAFVRLQLELAELEAADWPARALLLESLQAPTESDLRELAEGWDRARELDKALSAMANLRALLPQEQSLLLRHAQLFLEAERYGEAVSLLEPLLAGDSVSLQVTASEALAAVGRLDDAEQCLWRAAKLFPEQLGGWQRLLAFCEAHQRSCAKDAHAQIEERVGPRPTDAKRPLR
ncbi:MAG: hypothetical protein RBU37_02900 [Myxococcota bacterium]|jgi:predicted Zn-dependent protease|nr:hypothetical protein [Myxococcota bacterium]